MLDIIAFMVAVQSAWVTAFIILSILVIVKLVMWYEAKEDKEDK